MHALFPCNLSRPGPCSICQFGGGSSCCCLSCTQSRAEEEDRGCLDTDIAHLNMGNIVPNDSCTVLGQVGTAAGNESWVPGPIPVSFDLSAAVRPSYTLVHLAVTARSFTHDDDWSATDRGAALTQTAMSRDFRRCFEMCAQASIHVHTCVGLQTGIQRR